MARAFVSASSEYLQNDSWATSATIPMTLACWAYPQSLTTAQCVFWVGDSSAADQWFAIETNLEAGDQFGLRYRNTTAGQAQFGTDFTTNSWYHLCAVSRSTTDRQFYQNGVAGNSNATSITDFADANRVRIGGLGDSSPGRYFDGYVAEAAVWNVALDDDEIAALGAGACPLLVRPTALVFYSPLVRDEDHDLIGGLALSAGGTPTVIEHPRIIYPRRTRLTVPVVAGGGGGGGGGRLLDSLLLNGGRLAGRLVG